MLFMDSLILYDKNEFQVRSLVHMVNNFSDLFRMLFELKKHGLIFLKKGKIKCMNGLTIPSGEFMK